MLIGELSPSPKSSGFHLRFDRGSLGLGRKLRRRFVEIWPETGVGLGQVVEARVWVGVFSSPVREYQLKRLKLFCLFN